MTFALSRRNLRYERLIGRHDLEIRINHREEPGQPLKEIGHILFFI